MCKQVFKLLAFKRRDGTLKKKININTCASSNCAKVFHTFFLSFLYALQECKEKESSYILSYPRIKKKKKKISKNLRKDLFTERFFFFCLTEIQYIRQILLFCSMQNARPCHKWPLMSLVFLCARLCFFLFLFLILPQCVYMGSRIAITRRTTVRYRAVHLVSRWGTVWTRRGISEQVRKRARARDRDYICYLKNVKAILHLPPKW